MEHKRLTERNAFGVAYRGNMRDCLDRLAAYEDSGLSPEQVQELADSMTNKEVFIKCVNCGKPFPTKRPTMAKYCNECKSKGIIDKLWAQNHPERKREIERNWARKKRAELKALRENAESDTP